MSQCGYLCHPSMAVQTSYGIRPTNDHVVRRRGGTSSLHLCWKKKNKMMMMMIWIFLMVVVNHRSSVRQLLLLPTNTLWIPLVSASHSSDCGTADMTMDTDRDDREEIRMFGRPIRQMSLDDLSSVFNGLLLHKDGTDDQQDSQERFVGINRNEYQLVNISLVYHLLPQQGIGAEIVRKGNNDIDSFPPRTGPIMTDAQRDFATQATNRLFQIYNKQSKQTLPFASFVTYPTTIVHDNFITTKDCSRLNANDIESLVTIVPEWEFRMHVLVCELASISGLATFPSSYPVDDPQHNVLRVDYRTLACYDDRTGAFLCQTTNNNNNDTNYTTTNTTTQSSHIRWWRNRSVVIAHEIGHLFGLPHTFRIFGGCFLPIIFPDVPTHSASTTGQQFGCPGLLPYDRDRNLFSRGNRKTINTGANSDTCGLRNSSSSENVCGTTCAACCRSAVGGSCPTLLPKAQSVSEDTVSSPDCCTDSTPVNSCRFRRGIDPLNNVMSYAPDFCMYELTVGQMARMMTQIRTYKTYIYCNYGTRMDTTTCRNVPCSSFATGVNCVK